jgi:hypothetical protein
MPSRPCSALPKLEILGRRRAGLHAHLLPHHAPHSAPRLAGRARPRRVAESRWTSSLSTSAVTAALRQRCTRSNLTSRHGQAAPSLPISPFDGAGLLSTTSHAVAAFAMSRVHHAEVRDELEAPTSVGSMHHGSRGARARRSCPDPTTRQGRPAPPPGPNKLLLQKRPFTRGGAQAVTPGLRILAKPRTQPATGGQKKKVYRLGIHRLPGVSGTRHAQSRGIYGGCDIRGFILACSNFHTKPMENPGWGAAASRSGDGKGGCVTPAASRTAAARRSSPYCLHIQVSWRQAGKPTTEQTSVTGEPRCRNPLGSRWPNHRSVRYTRTRRRDGESDVGRARLAEFTHTSRLAVRHERSASQTAEWPEIESNRTATLVPGCRIPAHGRTVQARSRSERPAIR